MSGAVLSILLDVVVLVFLGVTIFYAMRLTESLNAFRRTRQEFDNIMRNLTRNIEEARRGIESLKSMTKESGQNLQKIVNDSRKMAVELETINQDSVRLAAKLEGLVESGSAEMMENTDAFDQIFEEPEEAHGFSIMDREYDKKPADNEDTSSFQSQAERDLYEALQRTRKSTGRGAA